MDAHHGEHLSTHARIRLRELCDEATHAVAYTAFAVAAREAVPVLLDEIERLQEPACQFAGPGRGDCEHFVGLNDDRDHYGRPAGWCVWCWQSHRLRTAEERAEAQAAEHERAAKDIADIASAAEARAERTEAALRQIIAILEIPSI